MGQTLCVEVEQCGSDQENRFTKIQDESQYDNYRAQNALETCVCYSFHSYRLICFHVGTSFI
jgi:serine/threonine protein phosphatase PrpC